MSPADLDRMSVVQPIPDGSRAPALFAYHTAGWTVFEDLSGYFASIPAKSWMEFARDDGFFLANHNAATGSAELIVMEAGRILREFLQDESLEETVDVGKLAAEEQVPIRSWLEIATIMEEDRLYLSTLGRVLQRGSRLGSI